MKRIEDQCWKVWFRAPEIEISCERLNVSFSEAMFCFYIVDRIKAKQKKTNQNKTEKNPVALSDLTPV